MEEIAVYILSAGMPRSASTWLFNAIRLLLRSCPAIADELGAGWFEHLPKMAGKRYLLLKLHVFDTSLADRARMVFYSYRDIRDAIASQQRRFGGRATIKWADDFVARHEQWMYRADYTMKYERMLYSKDAIVTELVEALRARQLLPAEADFRPPESRAVIEDLEHIGYDSPGARNPYFNEVTLYHPAHFTDGRPGSWAGTLDPGLVAEIEDKYRWWFAKYDYDVAAGADPVPAG